MVYTLTVNDHTWDTVYIDIIIIIELFHLMLDEGN